MIIILRSLYVVLRRSLEELNQSYKILQVFLRSFVPTVHMTKARQHTIAHIKTTTNN